MPLFSRRPRLPDDVRRTLTLVPGDKVLTAAPLADDGGWVVASRVALHVCRTGQEPQSSGWSQVDRGSFDPDRPAITVHWVTGVDEVLALAAPTPVGLAVVFRERVQSSVVHAVSVTVPRGGTVRVALRRAEDGSLFSQVIGGGAVDLDDPGTALLIDRAEQQVRAEAGLRD